MSLQTYLVKKFKSWKPAAPEVLDRSKCNVTLEWQQTSFGFLNPSSALLYRVERREKLPPWVLAYSGGKTTKLIDNLAPCSPHKFRLRVILKASAVPQLAEKALEYYGDERTVYEVFGEGRVFEDTANEKLTDQVKDDIVDTVSKYKIEEESDINKSSGDKNIVNAIVENGAQARPAQTTKSKWLESLWSEEMCTSTDSDGTSAACFCMAVRGGYLKQMQIMLEEKPALIGMINSINGFTPLATAVRKGDTNTVRFLLTAGADVNQLSTTMQTPLHLAALAGHAPVVELLLERGADFQARDLNELRVEHYAVDSGSLEMLRLILDKGGDVHVKDNNEWTPLFRAVCQGAETALIEELVLRGSDVDAIDASGLSITAIARLLKNRHGRSRDSILRLVDSQYPHEKAVANFTRLTKKISRVHTLFKM